ncbi:MAG: LacI family DNA-binding transcriptional regulator [Ilumatobacteraceae bacterium]
MGRITLQTVAERVGVSRSTVSNAYNRPDQLSSELRERILAAADDLGYAGPDPAASSLRRGVSGAIGLLQGVLWAVTDPANLLLLAGVAEVCEEQGLALVLIGQERPEGADVLATTNLDGLIVHCETMSDQRRRHLEVRGIPVVEVDRDTDTRWPSVGIDERGGAAAAARHLIDLGHRRIAVLVIGDGDHHWSTDERLAGYRREFDRAGLGDEIIIVDDQVHTRADGRASAARLLASDHRPTAVLAMSDELAAGVFDAAAELGIRVPDELSVVGFDDAPTATTVSPPLTTVFQDHREKGRVAARKVLGLDTTPGVTILPTRLVVRESTAPAAV